MLKNITAAEKIKNLYGFIKNDDLENLIKFFNEEPQYINFKNKIKNNLLFYSLEKKSYKSFNFILNKKPFFLMEKNENGFNCFSNLISKEKLNLINSFLENTSEKNIIKISQTLDNENNSLLMSMVKKGEDYFKVYEKYFSKYSNQELLSHLNDEGHSILHTVAMENINFLNHLLANPIFNKSDFNKRDKKGITPFLLASRFCEFPVFKIFAEKSDIYQKSDLNSNAFHFAAYSDNKEKIDFFLKNNFNPEEKNNYLHTPFGIAILEKKQEAILGMIDKVKCIEMEQFLSLIRYSNKKPELLNYILSHQNRLDPEILNNNIYKEKILNHIYYYCSFDFINKNQSFIDLFSDKENKNTNAMFFSSIAGRRDFMQKTSHIINSFGWISSQEGEYTNFAKNYPLGYLGALAQLPKTQFESLTKKNNLIDNFKDQDHVIFFLLCLNKNSNLYEKTLPQLNNISLKNQLSHVNMGFLSNLGEDKIFANNQLMSKIFHNCTTCRELVTDKISQYIYKQPNCVEVLSAFIKETKDKEIKKNVYKNLNELYLKDNKPHQLEKIFNNKFTILEMTLNKLLMEAPQSFVNKDYILHHDEIKIKPQSYLNYLVEKDFEPPFFLPLKKVDKFYDYFLNLDLNSFMAIRDEFALEIIRSCPLLQQKNINSKLFDYSINSYGLSQKTWESILNTLPEKSQREMIKNCMSNFLSEKGTNEIFWYYLEKKYHLLEGNKYSNNHIIHADHEKLLLKKLEKGLVSPYVNIFKSQLIDKYEEINILEISDFQLLLKNCNKNLSGFNKNSLSDFLEWDREKEITQKGNFLPLHTILKSYEKPSYNQYKMISETIDAFLIDFLINKKTKPNGHFSLLVNELLFNENPKVQDLILKNELFNNCKNLLTNEQNIFILNNHLENTLNVKNIQKKSVKI